MDRTPTRGSNFLGGCDSPSVLKKLYEEHKGKCEVIENDPTDLIKHLFTWKGSVYIEKLFLNEQDPLTKSFNIYQKIVREFLLACSLRKDTDVAEPQQSGGPTNARQAMLHYELDQQRGPVLGFYCFR
ncbi:hypothetical protein FXO38_26806 [Capsicum annuum]|nr:hypothetical protein FXO38_26806 [Capsicum annuum]